MFNFGRISSFSGYIKNRPLVWDTIRTTLLSTFGRGVGFLIPFFIAAWFGVTAETDAFFYAYGLIISMALILSPVVESIIVPFIAEARVNNEDVGSFVGKVLVASLAILLLFSTILLLLIKPLMPHISSFSAEGIDLISTILLEAIPLGALLVWTSILSGTLNAYKIFGFPAISPAFRAVTTISFIYYFKESMGVHSIAFGYVIGEAVRLAILFVLIGKHKEHLSIKLSLKLDKKIITFFKTSSYQAIAMSVLAINSILNKTMASWTGKGGVSVLEYSERLYMIPLVLLSSGFIVTLLSHWSSRYAINGNNGLKSDLEKSLKIIGITGILITIVIFFMKSYIVHFAYSNGKFQEEQLNNITSVFGYYALGIVPYFLSQAYTRAILVMKNTKILLQTAVIIITATVLFNYLLITKMGLAGIALASSLVLIVSTVYLHFRFYESIQGR